MTSASALSRPRHADLALIAYLAPMLQGRRVAVVGQSSGELCRRARALGASAVVSFGGVGDDIAVRALTPGALAAFHGKVDVVVIPQAGELPSVVAVLDEARRALGSEGVVVVASDAQDGPAPLEGERRKGPEYQGLRELCQQRFGHHRVLGRGPFLGYTVAALDVEPDGVLLETRLLDGDPPPPESFIAVASDTACSLDPLAVVQLGPEALDAARETATRALADELRARTEKLKEVENASAERWVKLQRLEHQFKELEEEARKARERAVRFSKELEDERKLRQRVELDAQMSRRAPELPKAPDLEPELRAAKEELVTAKEELVTAKEELVTAKAAQLAATAALATAQATLAAVTAERDVAQGRIADLEHELDETQAVEADLRAQLDEVDATPKAAPAPTADPALVRSLQDTVRGLRAELEAARAPQPDDGAEEYQRMERALAERGAAVLRLQRDKAALEQAVRELSLAVDTAARSEASAALEAERERALQARRVHSALADQAEEVVRENDLLRDRVRALEAQVLTRATEIAAATARVTMLQADLARLASPPPPPEAEEETPAPPSTLRHELETLLLREATQSGALAGARIRTRELEEHLRHAERDLADAITARAFEEARAVEARNEAARLFAQCVGLEARMVAQQGELEGARAGAARRVHELEAEVRSLLAALEVAGTQTVFEANAASGALARDLDEARAEAQGAQFRLREAELALAAARSSPAAQDVEALRALRSRVVEARVENESLRATIVELEREIEGLAMRRDASALDGLRAQEELAARASECDALRAALDTLSAEADSLRTSLSARVDELTSVRGELAGANAARQSLQGAVVARAVAEARASEAEQRALGQTSARAADAVSAERQAQLAKAERDGLGRRLQEAETALGAQQARLQAAEEVARVHARLLEAEREGLSFRVREAERALASRPAPASAAAETTADTAAERALASDALADLDLDLGGAAESNGSDARVQQLLADLSATAGRLAETEEALAAARESAASAAQEASAGASLAADVQAARAESEGARRDAEASRAAFESLRAQLDERDLRVAALERRLAQELGSMQQSLTAETQTIARLRSSLEGVRSGLSSILIDGRGAVVAHDLVMILRQIEAAG